jgi:copper transport protein
VIVRLSLPSTPLDDFLAGAGTSAAAGLRLERIGLAGSLTGALLAAGLLIFLAVVHRGPTREVGMLIRLAGAAGALVVIGAAVEVAGAARVLEVGWWDALRQSSAAMLRLLAGVLVVLGLFQHTASVVDPSAASDADVDVASVRAGDGDRVVRWVPDAASAFGIAGAAVGLLSFGFDGHTVSQGPRAIHALVDLVHVTAGSVWFGGVVALAVVAVHRRGTSVPASPLVVRFSSIATVALIAVALAGALMSLMITDGFGDYTGTPWGRILLVKVGAVALAVAVGGYNHFAIVPTMERDPDDRALASRARITLTVEAILLLFVAIATVFLTTASTN